MSIGRLPITGEHLFGRNKWLKLLDKAWTSDTTNVVSLVAWGGVGKSALVNHWLADMAKDNYRGARRVYGHSFYSQGTSDKTASADTFIVEALDWFGDPDPTKGTAWARGERLAELVRQERTLLVLDGMEPLQLPPGPNEGRVTDQALQALLRELAASNPGLCVVTTRQHVADLDRFPSTTRQKNLDELPTKAGAALLAALGVNGPQPELEQAAAEFGNHALALTLLGTYLAKAHGGDVRKRGEINLSEADKVATGGHARRVMASYEKWFRENGQDAEVSILRMLGLFNRPAEAGCIAALRAESVIPGLTDGIVDIRGPDWQVALSNLRAAGLVAERDRDEPGTLDAHPVVREHFGEQLKREHPEAWRAGHERLYKYLKGPGCKKEFPDTVEEMAPLYAAVVHGCAAGRHQEAFDEVYVRRIQRGTDSFNTRMLGALGAELGAVAAFFDEPWQRPEAALREGGQAFVLNEAGFDLRALGQLAEAVEPMLAGLEAYVAQEIWDAAAIVAGNVSELLVTLGRIDDAVRYAERSVEFAERSSDPFQRMGKRETLADALHEAGHIAEAKAVFQEAERLQKEWQPEYPLLYSLQGHLYCDLLLAGGDHKGVIERATQTLAWATENGRLLDIGLDHLSLGRAYLLAARVGEPQASEQARKHLEQAVDGLREAGQQHYLPHGLLARAELHIFVRDFVAARADLNEALDIATRDPQGQMKLFVTDSHLGSTRLALAQHEQDPTPDHLQTARTHLTAARRLIQETGYHRRDAELKELEDQVA